MIKNNFLLVLYTHKQNSKKHTTLYEAICLNEPSYTTLPQNISKHNPITDGAILLIDCSHSLTSIWFNPPYIANPRSYLVSLALTSSMNNCAQMCYFQPHKQHFSHRNFLKLYEMTTNNETWWRSQESSSCANGLSSVIMSFNTNPYDMSQTDIFMVLETIK